MSDVVFSHVYPGMKSRLIHRQYTQGKIHNKATGMSLWISKLFKSLCLVLPTVKGQQDNKGAAPARVTSLCGQHGSAVTTGTEQKSHCSLLPAGEPQQNNPDHAVGYIRASLLTTTAIPYLRLTQCCQPLCSSVLRSQDCSSSRTSHVSIVSHPPTACHF